MFLRVLSLFVGCFGFFVFGGEVGGYGFML